MPIIIMRRIDNKYNIILMCHYVTTLLGYISSVMKLYCTIYLEIISLMTH